MYLKESADNSMVPSMVQFNIWSGSALLAALATLWWGLLLLGRIRETVDRVLIGLIGLVSAFLGLQMAIDQRIWVWFANAAGVAVCLVAMSMLGRIARSRRGAEMALRLSEAREMPNLAPEMLLALRNVASEPKGFDISRTVLDAAPIAMFAVNLDGSVNYWNAAAERALGWTRDEVLGQRMPRLLAPSTSRNELLDGGFQLVRKDGAAVTGGVQSVPMRDERGTVSGILTIVSPATF